MLWGEFEDDNKPSSEVRAATVLRRPEQRVVKQSDPSTEPSRTPSQDCCTDESLLSLSLPDRILHHLASSTITIKSQQRYEPDLTYQERKDILAKLLHDKPGQFLYRFGKELHLEHLQHFQMYEGDAEVDYYLSEAQKHLNTHTARIRVKNRRYAALERLRRKGNYFSEKEMEQRDPLLYTQLIAQHQTQQEREESQTAVDTTTLSFSSMLLEHMDQRAHNVLRRQQEEAEDNMLEEEDSEEEEEEEEEEENEEEGGGEEEGKKRLYREEFYSFSYNDFLGGRHKDFDYGQIDASDDYDLLDIQARDEEESYFDHDSDDSQGHVTAGQCEASSSNLIKTGPVVEDSVDRVGEGIVDGMSKVGEGTVEGISRVCEGTVEGISRVCEGTVEEVDNHTSSRKGSWDNVGDSKMAIDASEVPNDEDKEKTNQEVKEADETMELG